MLSWPKTVKCPIIVAFLLLTTPAVAQLSSGETAVNLESFEQVWSTVRDRHPDTTLNGLDWQAIHDEVRPKIAAAKSMDEVRDALNGMVSKLGASHYAVISGELYKPLEAGPSSDATATPGVTVTVVDGKAIAGAVEPDSPAARAGIKPGMSLEAIDGDNVEEILQLADASGDKETRRLARKSVSRKLQGTAEGKVAVDFIDEKGAKKHVELARVEPKGKLVTFGNLPEQRVYFESRKLPGGAGYIHFNEFLDPVSIMPQVEAAVKSFAKAPGIVLDLRGNPGGIGIMAMGIAGFFVSEQGKKLGEMKMRDVTLKFVIYPRAEVYDGPLAILVDSGSASTSEILAQGMQDLGRARVFGTVTAGAALPSDIVRLPNGDGFQYAQASYTSEKGKVLEGAGVTPDEIVRQTREDLSAGRDPVAEAAEKWILSTRR
ncbi:MAG: peptidase [Bryobacterales bacterium]|nr:peptidase [Bryobacterales bacterium]